MLVQIEVTSYYMVLTEGLHARKTETSYYFNRDDSYTQVGASLEISKHVIRVPNHANSLELITREKGMKIVPRFEGLAPGITFLCKPNIETHEEPARHGNNSWAEYGIDWFRYKADDGRENIIWYSRIPPKKGTSKPPHTHGINPINKKGVFEHYLLEAGSAYVGEGENRKLMNEYEVVPPNTEHYIEAGGEGAIFFILIENVEGIKNEDIHQYLHAA